MNQDNITLTDQNIPTHNLHGTFISQKTNRIRWKPERLEDSHFFITGNVDDEFNRLTLWEVNENIEEDDIYPFVVAEQSYCGDITELKFFNPDYFASSSSSGSAHLMKIEITETGSPIIQKTTTWKDLHFFKNGEISSCVSLAVHDQDLVTVGEDGRINTLTADSSNIVRTIENADSCSMQCVIFLKHSEILTSNLRGQMKIWDLRIENNKPVTTFMLSGDQVTPTSLTFHPTQRHIILAGDELGAITTWDLRQNTEPVNVLNAHEGGITELQFHPENPDHLFSGSSAGEIWHWFTKDKTTFSMDFENQPSSRQNVWLAPENVKSKMEVVTLMPTLGKSINSLDIYRNKVICGCDNEAIYLINGINF